MYFYSISINEIFLNDIIKKIKIKIKKVLVLDLEKAYYFVEWDSLDFALTRFLRIGGGNGFTDVSS